MRATIALTAALWCGTAAAQPPPTPESPPQQCSAGQAGCEVKAEDESLAEPAEPRIDAPFGNAWLGAADGDVTLIVFADYACPACREAQTAIDQLVAADPKLKIVYRIMVNEDGGLQAARTSVAVAATKGADWSRFHHALDAGGTPSPETIARALAAAGIDPKSLPPLDDDSLAGSPLSNELINNESLLVDRKGKAIPAFVLGGGEAFNGFDLPRLQAAIAKARGGR